MKYAMVKDHIRGRCLTSLGVVREAGNAIFVAVIIFLAGAVLGLSYPGWAEGGFSMMKDIAKQLSGRSVCSLILFIFTRNFIAAALSVLTGPLLGIVSLLSALINGLLLGTTLYHIREMDRLAMLLRIVPHGIFEFPAMFMAWGLGIWQGMWCLGKDGTGMMRGRWKRSLGALIFIIVPLLLIAATIEGTGIHIVISGK